MVPRGANGAREKGRESFVVDGSPLCRCFVAEEVLEPAILTFMSRIVRSDTLDVVLKCLALNASYRE
jgi:hypothetical protein